MSFNSLKRCGLLLVTIGLLCGCSKSEWKKGTTAFLQDTAYNNAKSDCDVYKRGTYQYEECFNQVNTFYNENYPTDNIIDRE